ncbi:MAG: LemA family protein [Candidatus Aenigmatarchaeota archaeon]
MIGTLILVLLAFILLMGVYYSNRIIILSNRVDNAWSQIDVQLKKRADLVPNLVETVKGYMKHERSVIASITKARERMLGAKTDEEKIKADREIAGALKTIFALAENYPKLKANENFMMLQEELSGIENKIAYARQFYNDSILAYNNLVSTFPGVFFAKILGKEKKKHLEIGESERKPVKVEF